jgi:hypothetical protein
VPLDMFTCNGTCAARLFMQGAIADKQMRVQSQVLLCHSLMLTMLVGYSLKLKRINRIDDLQP